jgi:hypothetical protein
MAPCPTMVPALVAPVKPQVEGRFGARLSRIGPLHAAAGPARPDVHHPATVQFPVGSRTIEDAWLPG